MVVFGLSGSPPAAAAAAAADGPIQPDAVFWDEDGVLRYDASSVTRDRDGELRRVVEADAAAAESDDLDEWYIVDAGWMRAWLAYADRTVYAERSSPAPGPVRNERLLKDGLPKEGLLLESFSSSKGGKGHYRRVNARVWRVLCELYPGSGPAIRAAKPYDPARWVVDGASRPPVESSDAGGEFSEPAIELRPRPSGVAPADNPMVVT
ncbi:hypothetical protein CTAYLR_004907 [Chrysophaeum taylorii]|uniref:DUSP domain-containing protein n=1 Tax=Chrysophaeum taylorii TaxID=2483200 RepID=A0AAD7UNJ5_9STRA|nr:hypothetical protein CTAYLR_004907 [Chrysophaeum taylorii]